VLHVHRAVLLIETGAPRKVRSREAEVGGHTWTVALKFVQEGQILRARRSLREHVVVAHGLTGALAGGASRRPRAF
jgi:hypothetical protein